jgi:hypothetical protein
LKAKPILKYYHEIPEEIKEAIKADFIKTGNSAKHYAALYSKHVTYWAANRILTEAISNPKRPL